MANETEKTTDVTTTTTTTPTDAENPIGELATLRNQLAQVEDELKELRLILYVPNIICTLPSIALLGLSLWQFIEAAQAKHNRDFDEHMGWGSAGLIFFILALVGSGVCWKVRSEQDAGAIRSLKQQCADLRSRISALEQETGADIKVNLAPMREQREARSAAALMGVAAFFAALGNALRRNNPNPILADNSSRSDSELYRSKSQ